MQTFFVHRTLIWTNGGLIFARQNDICDEIIHLTRQAFSPNCVRGEYLIHLGHIILEEEVRHEGSVPETQRGISIRGLWESQTEAIIDVRFGDAYTDTWKS